VSDRTVREWLKAIKEEEKREKIKKALELREKGLSIREIAKELRVTERTIRNWFAEAEKMEETSKISASLLTPRRHSFARRQGYEASMYHMQIQDEWCLHLRRFRFFHEKI